MRVETQDFSSLPRSEEETLALRYRHDERRRCTSASSLNPIKNDCNLLIISAIHGGGGGMERGQRRRKSGVIKPVTVSKLEVHPAVCVFEAAKIEKKIIVL